MRSLLTLSCCALILSCRTSAPAPTAPAAPPVAAAPVTPPAPPAVELPPAPALPAPFAHLPPVEDSKTHPTTAEKVLLGRMLFFDKRLSKDGSMACENCHHIEKAYTSGNPVDPKVGGAMNKRNSPTMLNLAFHQSYYWDGRKPTLEAVSQAAWTGQLGADPATVTAALNAIPVYKAHFQRAFHQDASADNVPEAFAAFFRSLQSGNSAFDKYEGGEAKAVSKEAIRGYSVFKTAGCTNCHVPPIYTDAMFHNVGIGSDKPAEARDHGRKDATKDEKDEGKFKTPSMRDVAKTGPYFHDGSVGRLEDAIALMVAGGKKNPLLDEKLKPQKVSAKDLQALKAFLESLSGEYTFSTPPELP